MLMPEYLKWELRSPVACCSTDWGWSGPAFLPVHESIAEGAPPGPTLGDFPGCMTNMVLGFGCMSRGECTGAALRHLTECLHARSPQPACEVATLNDVGRAAQLLARFAVVGDTSRWNLSVCLLNWRLRGGRYTLSRQACPAPPPCTRTTSNRVIPTRTPHAPSSPALPTVGWSRQQVQNFRPTRSFEYSAGELNLSAIARLSLNLTLPHDPIDSALYALARRRFEDDLRVHGISTRCCPNYVDLSEAVVAEARRKDGCG